MAAIVVLVVVGLAIAGALYVLSSRKSEPAPPKNPPIGSTPRSAVGPAAARPSAAQSDAGRSPQRAASGAPEKPAPETPERQPVFFKRYRP